MPRSLSSPRPFFRLRLVALRDSGLDAKGAGQGRPRTGRVVCAADRGLLVGKGADVSTLTWHSHETDRAGSSDPAVKSNAMSEGLAEAERVTSWIIADKDYQRELRGRRAVNREMRVTTIMEQNHDLDMITTTDAKSLYDCLSGEQFDSTG